MSTWIDITDPDDVDIGVIHGKEELHVLYSDDDFGNNYVSIPLDIVKAAIEKHEGGK